MISSAALYEYFLSKPSKEMVLCRNDKEAEQIAVVARLAGWTPCVLPDLRVQTGDDLRSYTEDVRGLFLGLAAYHAAEDKKILIAPLRTVMVPLPKKEYFSVETLAFGDTITLQHFKEHLYYWGYHLTDIVAQQGEASFRGDIIDIFPIDSETPYRISLFDDEVESIHRFDPSTQKRQGDEEEVIRFPAAFLALDSEAHAALKMRCEQSPHTPFVKDIDALGLWHLDALGEMALDRYGAVLAENMDRELEEIYTFGDPPVARKNFVLPRVPRPRIWRDLEVLDVGKLIDAHPDKALTIVARNHAVVRGSMIALGEREMTFAYQEGVVHMMSADRLVLSLNKPGKRKKVQKASIVLDELTPGDYVVHEQHGIGIFKGLEKRDVLGATSEFVVIAYQGDDRLLIPVASLESIDRYIAEGGSTPVLDRMGKASFKRLKERVRAKLFAIAAQIVNLSAQRLLKKGLVFDQQREAQMVFMAQAGFEHTEDQRTAIRDMLTEMASGRIMDRLLSADVGFGKTEVAMNGIFVAVRNGHQAMMIAPTTLLSSQHHKSLQARLGPFGISVAKLDRFTPPKAKRLVLQGLADGTIDVVVGTHALLGATFSRLGFVVIDEEHKFGVKQKEALKAMAVDVHVLSMSATPIPRSLNLALAQLKSFSEMHTPPLERVGVRTFVASYDPKLIREAITRELRRGGQVFYVFNSIAGIEAKRDALLKVLPKLRIAVLHSKIASAQTEREMMLFENGEYDVLLSTSIVESGIHMPQVNTMIVDGADRFGMADLHQLRGRVGRGGQTGFCYFVVAETAAMTERARRRLLALESHSELGSGATLAYHDLQIRGGGNIIGEAQSGHIKQIGYGLYLRMLEDAIRELSGQSRDATRQVEMKLAVQAYLSDTLITEDRLRLELYRRLSLCEAPSEVFEVAEEIEDRFGPLDTPTRQFIEVMNLKVLARKKGISKISSYNNKIFIEYAHPDAPREILTAPSRDDDDILGSATAFFHKTNPDISGRNS